jgi:hypothetical protein
MFLRPADESDLLYLYAVASQRNPYWWRVSALGLPTPEDIKARLEHDCLMLYVVELDDEPIGAASLYEHSPTSGTVWLDATMQGSHAPYRQAAASLAAERAFSDWQVRKVYSLHHEFEEPVFGGLPCAWKVEGCLTERSRHQGRYWHQYLSAVYRSDWYAGRPS